MKVSTKGRYGLRILIDIAVHSNGAPRMIKDIAQSQGISSKYAGALTLKLRNAGLIKSIRGVKGGYVLARSPGSISIFEVFEAMEGKLSIVDCLDSPGCCSRCGVCAARNVWKAANDSLKNSLGWMTLASAISGYENV